MIFQSTTVVHAAGLSRLHIDLTHDGAATLASLANQPLYLALDGEVFSSNPLRVQSAGTLELEGLTNEQNQLIAALLDNDPLPAKLRVNMEEDGI